MTYLYHYTDFKHTLAIIRDQKIRASDLKSTDAVFGKGVYLTSMGEKYSVKEIVVNNWGDSKACIELNKAKVKFYFKVNSSDIPGVKSVAEKRDVWLYPDDLDLKPLILKKVLRVGHIKDETEWTQFCHLFHFESAITKSDEILTINLE